MAVYLKRTLILIALISLSLARTSEHEDPSKFDDDSIAAFSDDEISYALSDLSIDDLNTLSKIIDVLSEEVAETGDKNEVNSQPMSELRRFKRQSPDTTSIKRDQSEILPRVDQRYIQQLEESFPNIVDQPNQDDKDKTLIRVKRN